MEEDILEFLLKKDKLAGKLRRPNPQNKKPWRVLYSERAYGKIRRSHSEVEREREWGGAGASRSEEC